MKASELRIGNYILNDSNKIVDVTSVSEFSVMHTERKKTVSIKTGSQTELCNPIPLTEEWLVKFGLVKDKLTNFDYYKDDFEIHLPNYFKWKDSNLRKIKHVHQLQNLYFALTGKELT